MSCYVLVFGFLWEASSHIVIQSMSMRQLTQVNVLGDSILEQIPQLKAEVPVAKDNEHLDCSLMETVSYRPELEW